MNNIISITNHKNGKGLDVALALAKNSAVGFVKAYTDRPRNDLWEDCYEFVSTERLDKIMDHLEVLYESKINGHRYVFFKNQLNSPYNVLILDDYGVASLQSTPEYSNYFYSIKVVSKNDEESDRVGVYLYNHEFDKVFDYDNESIDDLEAEIESNLTWK